MSELLDIIIAAVDNASDVFKSVEDSATDMGDAIKDTVENTELDDLTSEIELLQSEFQFATEEVQRLEEELSSAKEEGDEFAAEDYSDQLEAAKEEAERIAEALSEATEEAQRLSDALKDAEDNGGGLEESVSGIESLMGFEAISDVVNQIADAMWQVTDKAGNVQDSINRMGLAAEGAGIDVDTMKDAVGRLGDETGRAGGLIRESFITMTSAGITDMQTMETVFKGASAQAFILGTDVQSLASKFSGMAMKSSLFERTLKGTGVTMQELGEAMGLHGATVDEVKDKWEQLDVNQRAAALGMAASMNEGKDANDAYKTSWQGLQDQIDKAKGKIEVLIGNIFLPVVIPVMEAAGRVLDWLGTTISGVMNGPFGTLISVVGSAGGALVLLLAGVTAITAAMPFLTTTLWPAVTASWALISPWLPWIALGAAIVAIVYEVGKAFGWWTDISSMMDAIWAGIQRLWSAFINHPDVQAALEMISGALQVLWSWIVQAGQAIMEFFGISTGGDFDIVRALIDGIGNAWNMITWPIRQVIGLIQNIMGVFDQFKAGQMDLPTMIWTVMNMVWNAYLNIITRIGSLVLQFAGQMLSRATQAGRNFLNGIMNQIRQVPNRVGQALHNVVATIVGAIAAWITAATGKVSELVSQVASTLAGLPGRIASAMGGVVDAITKPFRDAYDQVCKTVDDIKSKAAEAVGLKTAAGGDRPPITVSSEGVGTAQYIVTSSNDSLEVNENINLVLDLRNVPSGMDETLLIEALTDKNTINALVSNPTFQKIDARVKQSINLKARRHMGV